MTLGLKQERFSRMHMYLLLHIHSLGYAVREKHLLRCSDCKIGHHRSLHKLSLAIDIVLTYEGKLLTNTNDYVFAGVYWKSLGGSWGGDWEDGGHFSLAHQGMK